MRLAGTARQYSMKAIAQLMAITANSEECGNFRCPYQANVMKTFEDTSSRIGRIWGLPRLATSDDIRGAPGLCRQPAAAAGRNSRSRQVTCFLSEVSR